MGLNQDSAAFITTALRREFGHLRGLRMLELGDQVFVDAQLTGKQYFSRCGISHTSVDLNGLHGSLVRDLRKPQQFADWHEMFDVVTNCGTSEHVEPFEKQYECFEVIHNCTRAGGIMVHIVPDVWLRDYHGAWMDHCRSYYSAEFFLMLMLQCGYDVLDVTYINQLMCVVLRKGDATFVHSRQTFLDAVAFRPYSYGHRISTAIRRTLKRGKQTVMLWA